MSKKNSKKEIKDFFKFFSSSNTTAVVSDDESTNQKVEDKVKALKEAFGCFDNKKEEE